MGDDALAASPASSEHQLQVALLNYVVSDTPPRHSSATDRNRSGQ